MDKVTIKNLITRSALVKLRLNALNKEQSELMEEDVLLDKLISHYGNLEYDSIEEERNVTEAILNKPAKESSKRESKGKSKYDAIFSIIFEEHPNGLTLTNLSRYVNELSDKKIVMGTIYRVIETAITYGKATKEDKLYYWNFEKE